MIGWEARRFHWMERPKALAEYLKPAPTPERRREQGSRAVLALFKRIHGKKKEAAHGTG